ncbi:unnamed protein product [Ambrosiozyma monospora]|uniref:Unnamed protein product n=1 Tax=Ambrosiozyma monospora TaxID=43982 RepID=A0A9W6WLX3_AMBMO|nr:unnamed protein product [Ambrosiozyma monospora]
MLERGSYPKYQVADTLDQQDQVEEQMEEAEKVEQKLEEKERVVQQLQEQEQGVQMLEEEQVENGAGASGTADEAGTRSNMEQ